jgi:N-acyl-D-aspartate/D-glutamate deacylase
LWKGAPPLTSRGEAGEEAYDLIVRGGLVLDGTGADAIRADVGVRDSQIASVGDLTEAVAGRVVNASGFVVTPGFIDIHTHSDISATYDPGQASALAMGVTTQVVGNCGLSLGFATADRVFAFEQRWLGAHGARISWDTFAGHLTRIEERGIGTNLVPLAGHGTLRKRVMGVEERAASAADLAEMRCELDAAFDAGVWGLSSGLEYTPSSYADVAELTELCRSVAASGGLYATHLRNEGDTLVEAVQEAMEVAEGAEVPLQLSHHKAEGRGNWGKVRATLQVVSEARARGLDVQLDQDPYTAFMTALQVQVLPRHALSGSNEDVVSRLVDPAYRAQIVAEIRSTHPDWFGLTADSPWHNMRIGVCRGRPELQGRIIADLSAASGCEPIEFVLDLLVATEGYVSAVNFAIGEEDIAAVMRYPFTSIGSDGVATHPGGTAGDDRIHPRTYGTFARVLGRYVRELGVLTLPEAVHKMTGLPASRLGLTDRGVIRPGAKADLTVFDPDRIADRSTFDDPHRFATGIEIVILNGHTVFAAGAPTGTLAGSVLRKR